MSDDLTIGTMPSDQNTINPRSRAATVKTERRRREAIDGGMRNMRLTVADKDPAYEYRWVNDDPGRVHQLTVEDDWDVVQVPKATGDKRNVGVGTADERVVDKGTGRKAILVRKKREFYAADKAKEQKFVDQREDGLRRGNVPGESGPQPGDLMYVPTDGIKIGRN